MKELSLCSELMHTAGYSKSDTMYFLVSLSQYSAVLSGNQMVMSCYLYTPQIWVKWVNIRFYKTLSSFITALVLIDDEIKPKRQMKNWSTSKKLHLKKCQWEFIFFLIILPIQHLVTFTLILNIFVSLSPCLFVGVYWCPQWFSSVHASSH